MVASFLSTGPALAQNMSAEAARRFVAGKLFAFRCVDGSGRSGRIYADGSVIGKIQSNSFTTRTSSVAAAGNAEGPRQPDLRFAQRFVV